jgi:predicted XRE-type DNA-binding protein
MSDIDVTVHEGTENVFADIGQPNADAHLLKAQLVSRMLQTMHDQGLTQVKAAKLMGITQPEISRMSRGQFREVSADRLMNLLQRLGCEVDIVVHPRGRKEAYAPIHLQPA